MAADTIVVKLGGAVLQDEHALDALAADLHHVVRSGTRVVLVHGGGPQLDAALAKLGEHPVRHQGLRVTSAAAATIVERELNALGAALTVALESRGLWAQHVPSTDGTFPAERKVLGRAKLGRVGSVERFQAKRLPVGAVVAVVTPVGLDAEGPLNINADEGASAVASALAPDWLVLATDVDHVLDADGRGIARLDPSSAAGLLRTAVAQGGMVPKIENALAALAGGTDHVLIGRIVPGLLSAITAGEPVTGTLVSTELEATA